MAATITRHYRSGTTFLLSRYMLLSSGSVFTLHGGYLRDVYYSVSIYCQDWLTCWDSSFSSITTLWTISTSTDSSLYFWKPTMKKISFITISRAANLIWPLLFAKLKPLIIATPILISISYTLSWQNTNVSLLANTVWPLFPATNRPYPDWYV